MKKIISVMIIMVMTLGTLTTSVFAEGGSEPAAPGGFAVYSAFESVVLEWNKMDADSYVVKIDGKEIEVGLKDKNLKNNFIKNGKVTYQDKTAKDGKKHSYQVAAVKNGVRSAFTAAKSDEMAKTLKIKMTFKRARKLKSHDKYKKKRTFKKGYTAYADGYAGGRYFFWDEKGRRYYVNYLSVGNYKLKYDKKKNYSRDEAEYFVNTSGQTSMKKTMLWVSLYTQHVFVFQKKDGVWKINSGLKRKGKVYKDWEVSSGTATTPSPWGINLKYRGKKTNLFRKVRFNMGHGANYWNYFHSQAALHGPSGGQGYGVPHSHGCVRNPSDCALFILEKIPKKTRIIMY